MYSNGRLEPEHGRVKETQNTGIITMRVDFPGRKNTWDSLVCMIKKNRTL